MRLRALSAALVLGLAACGSEDGAKAPAGKQPVSERFAEGIAGKDGAAVCETLAADSKKALERLAAARATKGGCAAVAVSALGRWFKPGAPKPKLAGGRVDPLASPSVRELIGVSTACSGLHTTLRDTRPLPGSGEAKARALRRERQALVEYRRTLQAIDPDAAPTVHVGAQIGFVKETLRTHELLEEAAREGRPAKNGAFPVAEENPEGYVEEDENKFGADCGT